MSAARPVRRFARRGGQVVEFALLLPVLVTLASAVVDYGWYFLNIARFTAAIQDASRVGSEYPASGLSNPCDVARAAIDAGLFTAGFPGVPAGTVSAGHEGSWSGVLLTSEVRLTLKPLIGLVPGPTSLQATARLRVEDAGATSCSVALP